MPASRPQKHFRLRTLLDTTIAVYELVGGWLMVCMLWLFVPLFMLANVAVFFLTVESRPVWAAGTLLVGQGIGIVLLWVATWMFKELRRGRLVSKDQRS